MSFSTMRSMVDKVKAQAISFAGVPQGTDPPTGTVCTLIQGDFDKFIQFCLALLSLSVLVIKRWKEHPRRPFTIWAFDASKQCFGAGVAHLSNVFISIYFAHWQGANVRSDECAIYFLNFVLDTTFGVLVSYALLIFIQALAITIGGNCGLVLRSGYYGETPSLRIWAAQLTSWLLIIFATKLIIAALISIMYPELNAFGNWIFQSFEGNRKVELVLVMIVAPTILNAIQFWIQDNFLKASANDRESVERLPLMKVMTPTLKKLMKKRSSSIPGESKAGAVSITMKQALD